MAHNQHQSARFNKSGGGYGAGKCNLSEIDHLALKGGYTGPLKGPALQNNMKGNKPAQDEFGLMYSQGVFGGKDGGCKDGPYYGANIPTSCKDNYNSYGGKGSSCAGPMIMPWGKQQEKGVCYGPNKNDGGGLYGHVKGKGATGKSPQHQKGKGSVPENITKGHKNTSSAQLMSNVDQATYTSNKPTAHLDEAESNWLMKQQAAAGGKVLKQKLPAPQFVAPNTVVATASASTTTAGKTSASASGVEEGSVSAAPVDDSSSLHELASPPLVLKQTYQM
ncbi:unnamed protein product [Amoebophrya sp. A120]|nr:unnamed protein product [Amoebophrya sp. A120]|eukprot:GSA120T00013133001.1